ncbi:Rieske 2Fe-2S domain-containing protein [Rhodococcus sp. NPDC058639]|uniref:Rieske 2Fe-2S domain-containing protein n=1 Tax=Rhodococcus sp. NPDC058639 TaxID=3346570 RepID=UPI00364A5FAC
MTVWLPVALGRDIEPGAATGTTVDGSSVALWRDAGGTLHAWADRCPHRGMRLSFGFVREDRLVCLYHGWQFDGDGACRHVPAHPRMEPPGSVRPTRYRAFERGGLVWASSADPADDTELSRIPSVSTPVRSVWMREGREQVVDRLRSLTEDFQDKGTVAVGILDGTAILAGIQVVDAHTTALHLTAPGAVPDDTVRALVRRMHDLRDSATAFTSVAAS